MDKIKLRKIRDTMLKKLRKSFMQALQNRVDNHISLTNPEQIFYDTYLTLITDKKSSLKVCKHCGKAFVASRPNSVFCSGKYKNQYNVYKSRAKDKDNTN